MARRDQLEDDYREPFQQWQAAPNPENTSALLSAVQPVLDKGVAMHVGPSASPVTRSRARLLAIQAFKSYDPTKARLATHVHNHLQGLKRFARRSQQIFSVPEQMSMDAGFISQKHADLSDELGRDPTTIELADATGLSLKRIEKIRSMQQPMAEGTMEAATGGPESSSMNPAVRGLGQQQGVPPAVELLYHELDPVNQRILESSLGLWGAPKMSNQSLAAKLRITPSALSQRKQVLQRKLDEVQDLNLF